MNAWMVRAGEGGRLYDEFAKGYIAIGWDQLGSMADLDTREKVTIAHHEKLGHFKRGKLNNAIAMADKFRNQMQVGDMVVTYDPQSRRYLVGAISGEYEYRLEQVGDYPNIRKVDWRDEVPRDDLRTSTRNSLGSTLTLFSLNDSVVADFNRVLDGSAEPIISSSIEDLEENGQSKEDTVNRSKELIKDKLIQLDDREMEQLLAAVFRAMGYRTRVSSVGSDRNVDVQASPDGLGLTEPRIKAEVKHRTSSIGSQQVRSFIAALRQGDRGIYLSTGGFTKDARYEAERANVPVTLVDIDMLADLVITHYENFDADGRSLINLVRIYWPSE